MVQEFSLPIPPRASFIQLLGAEGAGTRRMALEMMKPQQKVIWLAAEWRIYAPLLWKLARKKNIQLLGAECADRKRWRSLWRELFESRAFDVWVLDHLHLRNAEGFFLRKLVQNLDLQVFVLEDRAHAFCEKRLLVQLQHHEHRVQWLKGAATQSEFVKSLRYPAPYLQAIRGE